MKKIFLGLLLLLSTSMFSQETFVKKYTSMISKKDGILQPWEKTDVTVVFNPRGVKDIVIYYSSGNTLTLHQIGGVEAGKTNSGEGYQIVECIDQDGEKLAIQLFDDDTCFRILIAEGYMIEFHND
ncbi:hypothetical protein [Flavobacterium aciduliphilum]|uniref:Uncharacterized protein n=1 Tax=Flavobacterium aciduliphilum TaxID=1101402 RepID=A0A328YD92_9FLAO|nr:hypothetical protein [Flavobacterium aciduliphilum]RAR71490.1 hypothetical protein CLV55_10746 [Flavobacterium aciduliphilum]